MRGRSIYRNSALLYTAFPIRLQTKGRVLHTLTTANVLDIVRNYGRIWIGPKSTTLSKAADLGVYEAPRRRSLIDLTSRMPQPLTIYQCHRKSTYPQRELPTTAKNILRLRTIYNHTDRQFYQNDPSIKTTVQRYDNTNFFLPLHVYIYRNDKGIEKMVNKDRDTFCKEMRRATREIHTISDTLVNTKLAFGFLDNSVWADGLLVFYEIFRYLELSTARWKHTEIKSFPLDELRRTEAFERDLEYYLGTEWRKDYRLRDSVTKYLTHLKEIENTEPTLLIAYIYHLYMGLLSGGIILRKKRQFMRKVWPFRMFQSNGKGNDDGNNITNFENSNVFELKRRMRDTMNEIADTLNQEIKRKLIEESKTVFALNNEVIKSVRCAGTSLLKKLAFFIVPVMLFLFALLQPFKQ